MKERPLAAFEHRETDKLSAATHRFLQKEGSWRGAYRNDRTWGDAPVALKRTLTGEGPTITLDMAEDLMADLPEHIELRVRLDQRVKGDVVRVWWDETEMEYPEICYCTISDPHRISDVSSAAWLCFEMDPAGVEQGAHEVKVVLVERHPQLACDIVLTDVEWVIRYGKH